MFFENLVVLEIPDKPTLKINARANISIGTRVVGKLKSSLNIWLKRKRGDVMSANETLELISKQWCNLNDLMLLGEFGRNTALKVKKEIKDKLTKQGYRIPKHVIPMKEVVDYLDINISYLESRAKKGE